MQEDIIRAVVAGMLPLRESASKTAALEAVKRYAAGGTDRATARVKIREALEAAGYQPGRGEEDTFKNLYSEERLDLMLETTAGLANGARDFAQSKDPDVVGACPARELFRMGSRDTPRDWPARWSAAGGRFFSGKSDYPEGRMIALNDDPIWETISHFGLPFPPFAFGSGMWVRSIARSEAKDLGLIAGDEEFKPAQFDVSTQTMQRLAATLGQCLSELESEEQRRRTDPLNHGTGDDLLELALKKLGLSLGWAASRLGSNGLPGVFEEDPGRAQAMTPERIAEVRTLADKSIERGFGDNPERLAGAYCALARIYTATGQPDRALQYQQQGLAYQREATRLSVDFLLLRANSYDLIMTAEELLASTTVMTAEAGKQILGLVERAFEQGIGEKYNLRPKAHRILAEVCEQTGEPEKAETNRVKYLECADGVLLLRDAQAKMAVLGEKVEAEPCARILDMLTKAVPRLPADRPKLHAEAYRATAEVLEALGDAAHAVEYYECALQMDPKIAVGKRLNALRKKIAAI